ncbi:MAG: hypothetical protein U9R19_11065, partial [Bacteroidota bacterium]|nr:hypothetical protein [Bacteroidota bacterium]
MITKRKSKVYKFILSVFVLILTSSGVNSQCDFSSDFESGTLTDWTTLTGTNIVSQQQVHTGNYALKMGLSGGYPKIETVQGNFGYGIYDAWFYVTGSYSAAFLQLNYLDNSNYLQVGMMPQNTDNPKLNIATKVNGNSTVLAQVPPVIGLNEWFKMTVIRKENGNIEVYINDVFQVAANDTSNTQQGKVRIMGFDQYIFFDDFCYRSISTTSPTCDVFDDFENVTLSNWNVLTGSANLSQDHALSDSTSIKMDLTGDYPAISSIANNYSFGKYSAWFWVTGPYSAAFFRFPYIDINNYYQLGMMPVQTDNPKLSFYKMENGIQTQFLSVPPVFDINSWFKMTLEWYDNGDIKVYINDSIQIQLNDTTFLTPGPIVFTGYDHSTYIDDFCYLIDFPQQISTINTNKFNIFPNPTNEYL